MKVRNWTLITIVMLVCGGILLALGTPLWLRKVGDRQIGFEGSIVAVAKGAGVSVQGAAGRVDILRFNPSSKASIYLKGAAGDRSSTYNSSDLKVGKRVRVTARRDGSVLWAVNIEPIDETTKTGRILRYIAADSRSNGSIYQRLAFEEELDQRGTRKETLIACANVCSTRFPFVDLTSSPAGSRVKVRGALDDRGFFVVQEISSAPSVNADPQKPTPRATVDSSPASGSESRPAPLPQLPAPTEIPPIIDLPDELDKTPTPEPSPGEQKKPWPTPMPTVAGTPVMALPDTCISGQTFLRSEDNTSASYACVCGKPHLIRSMRIDKLCEGTKNEQTAYSTIDTEYRELSVPDPRRGTVDCTVQVLSTAYKLFNDVRFDIYDCASFQSSTPASSTCLVEMTSASIDAQTGAITGEQATRAVRQYCSSTIDTPQPTSDVSIKTEVGPLGPPIHPRDTASAGKISGVSLESMSFGSGKDQDQICLAGICKSFPQPFPPLSPPPVATAIPLPSEAPIASALRLKAVTPKPVVTPTPSVTPTTTPTPKPCCSNADCDDDEPCTEDICNDVGRCIHNDVTPPKPPDGGSSGCPQPNPENCNTDGSAADNGNCAPWGPYSYRLRDKSTGLCEWTFYCVYKTGPDCRHPVCAKDG